jgi:hypothetical protein
MICANGEQKIPEGDRGIFFICQHGDHKGNHCRFSRWCKELQQYVATTDKNGNVCKDFTTKWGSEI